MNNLKSKLLKALMGVSLGALGAFVVTFVIYFWNLDMKLTCDSNIFQCPSAMADGHFLRPFSRVNNL